MGFSHDRWLHYLHCRVVNQYTHHKTQKVANVRSTQKELELDSAFFGVVSGPSDGPVFTANALYTAAIIQRDAHLLAKEVIPVNHFELVSLPAFWRWIQTQLGK